MKTLVARMFVFLQLLLPRHLLTALVFRIARIRTVNIKNYLINAFVRLYDVEVDEVLNPVPDGFATFNDFFVRELADGARPVDESAGSIVSPVDGTVSAAGRIEGDRVFQAKGRDYTLTDLLATDLPEAERYIDGTFATIYLAPYNYHRVHAPLAGRLTGLRYVPGALFSVNDATVRFLPRLFVRNERLVCHLQNDAGPYAVIFVGAMNVGSITTPWTGQIRPRKTGVVENIDVRGSSAGPGLRQGELMGWFNMGSTVILLLPAGAADAFDGLLPGQRVRMGSAIGSIASGQ